MFSDIPLLLACVGSGCVFLQTKVNGRKNKKNNLLTKYLKDAIIFFVKTTVWSSAHV